MSKKKAGILVGIGFIVVGIVFFVIFGVKLAPNEQGEPNPQNNTQVEHTQPVPQSTDTETQQPQTQTVQQPATQSQFFEVSDDSFESLTKTECTEVAIVSRKYIQCDTKMQLFYTVDILLANNQTVSYYVSAPGYASLSVGTKVTVTYELCTNANGANLVLVTGVSLTE